MRSASAWRSDRYSATMSWPHMRSRNRCSETRLSSSGTRAAWRPNARSASIRSSSAARRSSSRWAASMVANGSPWKSSSACPLQRCNASLSVSEARAGSDVSELRATRTSRSKRAASTLSGSTTSMYPGEWVTMLPSSPGRRFGCRASRSFDTWNLRVLSPPPGGSSPHRSSMMRSLDTTWFAESRRMARSARSFGAVISTG